MLKNKTMKLMEENNRENFYGLGAVEKDLLNYLKGHMKRKKKDEGLQNEGLLSSAKFLVFESRLMSRLCKVLLQIKSKRKRAIEK